MSNPEINRQIVQAGLDHRAAEFKKREAVLEKQARLLRLIINDNHTTKTTPKASERPQNKPDVKEEPQVQEQAVPLSRQEQEDADRHPWYRFMFMVFAPLILVSMLVFLAGGAPITIPLLILLAAYTCLLLVMSIIAFFPKPDPAAIKQFVRSLI